MAGCTRFPAASASVFSGSPIPECIITPGGATIGAELFLAVHGSIGLVVHASNPAGGGFTGVKPAGGGFISTGLEVGGFGGAGLVLVTALFGVRVTVVP